MKAKMTKYAPANYGFALKEKKKPIMFLALNFPKKMRALTLCIFITYFSFHRLH